MAREKFSATPCLHTRFLSYHSCIFLLSALTIIYFWAIWIFLLADEFWLFILVFDIVLVVFNLFVRVKVRIEVGNRKTIIKKMKEIGPLRGIRPRDLSSYGSILLFTINSGGAIFYLYLLHLHRTYLSF
jgi:hypothetical protein